ncbi:MAG TPA: hypothetical protein ENN40_02625 [Candidatus Aminicenantes bacterium]|nr:hypothetical protein [Candidatus Aminicenantes bacterium]
MSGVVLRGVVRAVGMLRYGKVASLDEAMAAAGYRDRKYFNKLVHKAFGKSLAELDANNQ